MLNVVCACSAYRPILLV